MLRRTGSKAPIGVILAGGRGTRMGGSKLTVLLSGRPLIDYPLQAMKAALPQVAVIAKPGVELPEMSGVTVWLEPAEPHHPLLGIVEGLAMAGGRPIVVCPADLPFVTSALIARLAEASTGGAPAVIAGHQAGDRTHLQPLLGCYRAACGELLAEAARAARAPARETVAAIGPKVLNVEDPDELFNVNSPDDLLMATGMLDRLRAGGGATRT